MEISKPASNQVIQYQDNLVIEGTASIGQGHPDVAYIYVIDTSGSTGSDDGECGTVLDCVQDFFKEFHNATIQDGGAHYTAVINFNDFSDLQSSGFVDPNELELVQDSIDLGYSSGGTDCYAALQEATRLAELAANMTETTVVVFAGDGECNEASFTVQNYADELGATGAIVHSVAVGDSVECGISQGFASNDLSLIPQNGGRCTSVPDPHTLPTIIDDLIGAELTDLQVFVDGQDALSMMNNASSSVVLTDELPLAGAASLGFSMTLVADDDNELIDTMFLSPGAHQVCVQVTGNDTLGDSATVQECVDFVVSEEPSMAPSMAPSTMKPTSLSGDKKDKEDDPLVPLPTSDTPKNAESSSPPSSGVIAGAVVSACVGVTLLGFGVRSIYTRYSTGKEQMPHAHSGGEDEVVVPSSSAQIV